MDKIDPRTLPVDTLKEHSRRAVKMRLEGTSLKDTPNGLLLGDAGLEGLRAEGGPRPVKGFQRNGRSRPGDRLRRGQGHRTDPHRPDRRRHQVIRARRVRLVQPARLLD